MATPTPTAPPTPTATATVPPTPTPKPEFTDPLTSNTHGWPDVPGHCTFANGGLQVTYAICDLSFFDAQDGALSVDVKATSGDEGYGLVWRASSGGLYAFAITQHGTWGFLRADGTTFTTLDSGSTTALNQGAGVVNSLWVSFRGSVFAFVINGVQVGHYEDALYTDGVIGLFVLQDTTAVFNNFAYYE